jgi:hypothetical protein
MKLYRSLRALSVIITILLAYSFAWPGVRFCDPNIPDGEKITYNLYIDDDLSTCVREVSVKEENGREIYEIVSKSKVMDQVIKIYKDNMFAYSTHIVRKGEEATISRKTELLEYNSKPEDDEDDTVAMVDFSGLNYILRGFPFDKIKYIKLKTIGEKSPFFLKVKLIDKEKMKVNDKEIDCFKLKLSVSGIFGKLFSKTYLWYSVDAPHYLVRYDGPMGGPGSPRRVLELIDYSVKSNN